MSYTMGDFRRDFLQEHFPLLTLEEQRDVLQSLSVEERMAGLSVEEIQQYLDRLSAKQPAAPRKPRRKK